MKPPSFPGPLPLPGQQVRWRHPRLALALGRFNAFGPGPFEVLEVIDRRDQGGALLLLVRSSAGVREIPAVWLGPVVTQDRSSSPSCCRG
jgi:hypothetical protein